MKALIFALSLFSARAFCDDFFNNPTQSMVDRVNAMQLQDMQRQQMIQQQAIPVQGVGSQNFQSGFSGSYNSPPSQPNGWNR